MNEVRRHKRAIAHKGAKAKAALVALGIMSGGLALKAEQTHLLAEREAAKAAKADAHRRAEGSHFRIAKKLHDYEARRHGVAHSSFGKAKRAPSVRALKSQRRLHEQRLHEQRLHEEISPFGYAENPRPVAGNEQRGREGESAKKRSFSTILVPASQRREAEPPAAYVSSQQRLYEEPPAHYSRGSSHRMENEKLGHRVEVASKQEKSKPSRVRTRRHLEPKVRGFDASLKSKILKHPRHLVKHHLVRHRRRKVRHRADGHKGHHKDG